MSDVDDDDDPIHLDPDADMYEALLEILDEGRFVTASFIRPGLVYYRSYDVAEWSLVMTGTSVEREQCVVQIMRIAHEEGKRADS